MSEIRTMNTVLNRIFSVDQINRSLRATVREVAEMFGHMLELGGSTAVFLGGFECSGDSGTMYSLVTKGSGFAPATRSLPIGNALFIFSPDDIASGEATLQHSDGDGTHPRVDVITVKPASVTDTNEGAATYPSGATTPTVDIQRGCAVTFNIIEGTPAASPLTPSVPADEYPIAHVLVPSGLTAGGGGMALATYVDVRAVKNPSLVQNFLDHEVKKGLNTFDAYNALSIADAQATVTARALSWYFDGPKAWWGMRRSNPLSGDYTGTLYPMMVPAGRTWKRTVGLERLVANATSNCTVDEVGYDSVGTKWGGFEITWSASLTASGDLSCQVFGDARGLEVVGVELEYFVAQTLSSGNVAARIGVWDNSVGSHIWITNSENLADISGQGTHTFTLTSTPVLDDGDFVFLWVALGGLSTATPANYFLQGITCEVYEGRV